MKWLEQEMEFIFEVRPGCLISGIMVSVTRCGLGEVLVKLLPVNWLK